MKVWLIATQELHHSFQGHKGLITSLVFKLNSHELVSASKEGQMIIWDVKQKGKIEQVFAHKSAVLGLSCLSQDSILSAGYDRRVALTNLDQGRQLVFDS